MLQLVLILVAIALVILFLFTKRRHAVIYRKRVAPTNPAHSVSNEPDSPGSARHSDHSFTGDSSTNAAIYGALAFDGGEFGGSGAGESYESSGGESGSNNSIAEGVGETGLCSDPPGGDPPGFSTE